MDGFLNLHEFVDIILTDMIDRLDGILIIRRPLIVSCSGRDDMNTQKLIRRCKNMKS